MKLYEFPQVYRDWMKRVEENDGEINDVLAAELEALGQALSDKVDAYCALVRQYDAEREAYAAEAQFFRDKAGRADRRSQKMKWLILQALKALEVDSVRGRRFFVRRQTNHQPVIVWDSPQDPPEPFQRVRIELDKLAAIEVYKEMGSLPEGFKVSFTEFVVIR